MRQSIAVYGRFFLAFCCCAYGCASNAKIRVTSKGELNYERLSVVYDVVPKEGAVRLDEPPAIQQTGLSTSGDGKSQPAGRVRLEVTYPYPGVHPGFARASLRVISPPGGNESAASGNQKGVEELLVIDFPKTELDGLLYDLANDGYFERKLPATTQSQLAVTYNQGRVQKAWTREPRLEHLIEILKAHGIPTTAQHSG